MAIAGQAPDPDEPRVVPIGVPGRHEASSRPPVFVPPIATPIGRGPVKVWRRPLEHRPASAPMRAGPSEVREMTSAYRLADRLHHGAASAAAVPRAEEES